MTPQEKCQQIADVLGVEVWMAMDEIGDWQIFSKCPFIKCESGADSWTAQPYKSGTRGDEIPIKFPQAPSWKDSLVHAEPNDTMSLLRNIWSAVPADYGDRSVDGITSMIPVGLDDIDRLSELF